jgi:hypothetical protein
MIAGLTDILVNNVSIQPMYFTYQLSHSLDSMNLAVRWDILVLQYTEKC